MWVVADLVDVMDSDGLSLSTPDSFPIFPYEEPYNIQLSLMQHLYRAIEDRSIAVVESPTGTVNCLKAYQNFPTLTISLQGKTASLLSATISWLLDDNERAKKGCLNDLAMDDRAFSPFPNPEGLTIMDRSKRLGCFPGTRQATTRAGSRGNRIPGEASPCSKTRGGHETDRKRPSSETPGARVGTRDYPKNLIFWKKLTHPVEKNPSDEDAFLPDDFAEQEFEDGIDPSVRALMRR